MVRVGVVGAAGRMGVEVCRAVAGAPDLTLVAAVDPASSGTDLATLTGGDAGGLTVEEDLSALAAAGAEVAVDFTEASVSRHTMAWCADHGIHTVVGTSGLAPGDLEEAARHLAAGGTNAVVASNFAIGGVLLMRFCELAAPFMEGVEIIELHHGAKRDAPSGTAMDTARRIAGARLAAGSPPLPPDPTEVTVMEGPRGGVAPGGVLVHSVRLPGLVAHQEVVFGAAGQSLTLRHDSYDRCSFMPGVLLAVRAVSARPGLTVGLEPLLGLGG
jgi:4-hydroxy-tetrahydrodipicolinate reductase